MATLAEVTFMQAVAAAEGVRQTAKTAAFATWAFGSGATLTTYLSSLKSADKTYLDAISAAINTAGAVGISVPNAAGSAQVGDVILGNSGSFAPFTGSYSSTLGKYA